MPPSPLLPPSSTTTSTRPTDFLLLFSLSAFLLILAALLRLIPWLSPLPPHPQWHPALTNTSATTTSATSRSRYGSMDPSYESLLALSDAIGQAKTGLSDVQISMLFVPATETDLHAPCSVCREPLEMDENGTPVALPCGDVFHATCITRWLRLKNTCPLCRCVFA